DTLADDGEGLAEELHAFVLGFVADFSPAGMIAALLAAFGVAAGGLEGCVGAGAGPDVGPCGRDDEGLDTGDEDLVGDEFAVGVEELEALAATFAGEAGHFVGDVAKAGEFGGLYRVEDDFRCG